MQEAAAVRWRKYGKDRLYVNAADGTRLGWRDLLTGADNLEPGAPAGVYHAVVTAWLDEHPAVRSSGMPPTPVAHDVDDAPPAEPDRGFNDGDPGPIPSVPAVDAALNAVLDGVLASDPEPPSSPSAEAPVTSVHATAETSTPPMAAASALPSPEVPDAGDARDDGDDEDDEDDLTALVASLVAAHESDLGPHHDAAVDADATGDDAWEDLAERRPGAAARAEALRLRRDRPIRTVAARVLRVHTDERAWRIGADGEEKVAVRLAKLAKRDPRWRILHAVPVGERGSDIDHLVIGPPGVFTLNAKHHPDANIWIGGDTFMVNGHRQPYVRNSRFEARRAGKLLSAASGVAVVAVGVVVPVGAATITVKKMPPDVKVVNRMRLVRWLDSLPTVLPPERIEAIYGAARRSTTWQPERQ